MDIDDPHPLGPFLDAAAIENGVGLLSPAPAGWCSWYYYYENISKEIIQENLNQINRSSDRLPLELVQIDDGFEAQVGDWLETNSRFSGGMAPLAKEIRAVGLTPGLWLAPFILHPEAHTAVEHPDWLLRGKNGKAVKAGFGWNTFTMALDLTVPQALEYACEVVDKAVHRWGYPYLKLDFLYAAALKGVYHDTTRTRAQVLRSGMEALRRSAAKRLSCWGAERRWDPFWDWCRPCASART
jgi:alpha-galactosidase